MAEKSDFPALEFPVQGELRYLQYLYRYNKL